jgi:Sortilin, neurotensin receptor 3,
MSTSIAPKRSRTACARSVASSLVMSTPNPIASNATPRSVYATDLAASASISAATTRAPRFGEFLSIDLGIEIGALLTSNDFGETFEDLHVDPQVGENDIHRILVNRARPNRILIANGLVGVTTSEDNGRTWHKNPMPADANYPDPIVIHPEQPDLVFLSGSVGWPPHRYKLGRARGKSFRSRDAGQTWERLLGGPPNGQRATSSALTIETWDGGYRLYAADTDGQVFESLDGGKHLGHHC